MSLPPLDCNRCEQQDADDLDSNGSELFQASDELSNFVMEQHPRGDRDPSPERYAQAIEQCESLPIQAHRAPQRRYYHRQAWNKFRHYQSNPAPTVESMFRLAQAGIG